MKEYQFAFVGRKRGAIGIHYAIKTSVRAGSSQGAWNSLYQAYEVWNQPRLLAVQAVAQ